MAWMSHSFRCRFFDMGSLNLEEGNLNWTLVKNGIPFTIPKKGALVSRALLEACLADGILSPGDYFEAARAIGYKF